MPIKPFTSKICPACGIDKPRSEYYKKGDGVSYRCKPCSLENSKERAPRYFGKYRDYVNAWKQTRYANDPAYREKISQQKAAAYASRKDDINAARRDRWKNDPNCPARKYFRRKDVKDRTPRWVDLNEVLTIYADCPKGMHVDHIVPLKGLIDGRPVTGLHVPWNLQYLTPAANQKKRNRISEADLLRVVKQ